MEIGGPLSRRADFFDVAAHGIVGLHLGEDHVRVAENDGKHVVEIVGDAARQPSHGFHLLRVAELLLLLTECLFGLLAASRLAMKRRRASRHARLELRLKLAKAPVRLLNLLRSPVHFDLHLPGARSQLFGHPVALVAALLEADELGDVFHTVDDVRDCTIGPTHG